MRITADTAILVRANARAAGPARELLKVIQESGARLVPSPFILEELQRVLRYPRLQAIYRLTEEEIREFSSHLWALSDVVTPAGGTSIVLRDQWPHHPSPRLNALRSATSSMIRMPCWERPRAPCGSAIRIP